MEIGYYSRIYWIRIKSNIYLIFDLSTSYGYKEVNISNNSSEEPNLINYIQGKINSTKIII